MEDRSYKPIEVARMLGISKEMLVQSERDGKVPPCRRDTKGNRHYTSEDVEVIRKVVGVRPGLAHPPVVLAVFNMKGGVGKSTVAANLAWKMAENGFRTLAVDADPQGHLTTSLGQEPSSFERTLLDLLIPNPTIATGAASELQTEISPNLDLLPANLSMCALNSLLFQQPEREYRLRGVIDSIREVGIYDLVVIDSPPSYDLTSLNILLACDVLLAPVRLDGNSFYGLQYLFDSIGDIGRTFRYNIRKVAIVPNHFNGSYVVSRQILGGLRKNYGPYVTRTVIRQDVNIDKANALRSPIFITAASSKGSRDLAALAVEVSEMIAGKDRKNIDDHNQE